MPSLLTALGCAARATRSSVPAHRLADVGDHLLRDLGLRRTDLYALPHLHGGRLRTRVLPPSRRGAQPAPGSPPRFLLLNLRSGDLPWPT